MVKSGRSPEGSNTVNQKSPVLQHQCPCPDSYSGQGGDASRTVKRASQGSSEEIKKAATSFKQSEL